jgi:hypothetical protein
LCYVSKSNQHSPPKYPNGKETSKAIFKVKEFDVINLKM